MCLYASIPSLLPSMRLSTIISSHQHPPPVIMPWPSLLLCDWLNGVPSAALGLLLRDQEFCSCLRYWLCVPLHITAYSCPECHAMADPYGDHQVACGGNGDRIARHNAIHDVLYSAAQSAALGPSKEMPHLVSSSLSRLADIYLPTWSRPAALDVHVISPLQQQTLGEAASTPGHALQVGVRRKLTSHLAECRSVGVEFIPIVAEALGGLVCVCVCVCTYINHYFFFPFF